MDNKLPERIFLCGFMGAGKSTIGKVLADKISLPFFDLDEEIERRCKKSITEIFKKEGEKEFRTKERKQIEKFIAEEQGVFALGGGSLQNQQLTNKIKQNGLLIFIDCSVDELLTRIKKNKKRPLLLNNNGSIKNKKLLHDELQTLYEQRLPFYRQAEIQIDSSAYRSTHLLVNHLENKIMEHAAQH